MKEVPKWFEVGGELIEKVSGYAMEAIEGLRDLSSDQATAARCALYHYVQCLELSGDVNREGQHAVAISLTRQCVEALTVLECALISDRALGQSLLSSWINNKKTSGLIRKELSSKVWGLYFPGLWLKPWADYYREFCNAVQSYAHYSRELQGWQLALMEDQAHQDKDGNYLLFAKIGLGTYDANKATRITLLHILLSWTLGQIMRSNNKAAPIYLELQALQGALEVSDELGKGAVNWEQQFWAHEFELPSVNAQQNPTS